MGKVRDALEEMISGKKSFLKKMSTAKIIAMGYFIIILVGTALLSLPFASRETAPGVLGALFTATSATCVTGLVVFDTYTQWSVFGRIVIITLIQIGGMGFMTIISLMAVAMGRKIGLKERSVLQESVNNTQLGGIVKHVKKVALRTIIIESIGTVLLSLRLVPAYGFLKGLGYGAFLSVSAFCNAGFDLFGSEGAYSSLSAFRSDILINITVCLLILIGGIGFMVWDDVVKYKLKFSAYRLHSKMALTVTGALTVIGTVLFFCFEYNNTLAGVSVGQGIVDSLFNSVTPRTAGFNTVDTAALTPASKMLTIVFMFVGGSPGSTAGGVKTVTVAVIAMTAISSMRGSEDINIFGRRLEEDAANKALTVAAVNLTLVMTAILTVSAIQPELRAADVIFEAFSAINTVGMTTGITRDLSTVSKLIMIILMYCGRVGSVSFALVFTGTKKYTGVHNPVEQISIG